MAIRKWSVERVSASGWQEVRSFANRTQAEQLAADVRLNDAIWGLGDLRLVRVVTRLDVDQLAADGYMFA